MANSQYYTDTTAYTNQRINDLRNERTAAANRIKAQVQAQVDAINAQRPQLKQQFTDDAQAAYVNNMQAQKDLPQQLAAAGYNGGMSESSRIALDNNYGTNYNKLQTNYNTNLQNLENQIEQIKANGASTLAQSDNDYADQISTINANAQQYLSQAQADLAARKLQAQLDEKKAENDYTRDLALAKYKAGVTTSSSSKKNSSSGVNATYGSGSGSGSTTSVKSTSSSKLDYSKPVTSSTYSAVNSATNNDTDTSDLYSAAMAMTRAQRAGNSSAYSQAANNFANLLYSQVKSGKLSKADAVKQAAAYNIKLSNW